MGERRFSQYRGITHEVPIVQLNQWKKEKCPIGVHAFDEVLSDSSHHLTCDACGLKVVIKDIDTTHVVR